jgi:hypothetical protein
MIERFESNLEHMPAVDTVINSPSAIALPGLGRALVVAGKLGQKAAEDRFGRGVGV